MSADEPIRSRANPLVRRVRAVRAGREAGLCLLEGRRLVADALASGLELELVLVAPGLAAPQAPGALVRRVAADVLASLSALGTPPGLLALARAPQPRPLEQLAVEASTLLVVAAGVQDPGNLGAIARAAEAAGAHGLALAGQGAQPCGERALRGSMGSLLRLPLWRVAHPGEPAARGLRPVVARAGGADARSFDWSGPLALWLPGETGAAAVPADAQPVGLPMAGRVESLNVAVAAAVLLYAAGRI